MNLREIYVRERLRQGQLGQLGEEPALYFLGEILFLRHYTPEDLREIHEAKLKFIGMRIIQDAI